MISVHHRIASGRGGGRRGPLRMQIGPREELWGRVCFDVSLSGGDFLKDGSGKKNTLGAVIEGP